MTPGPRFRFAAHLFATLALGALGGLVFSLLNLPAPWLSGPVVTVAIAAMSGFDVAVPSLVRHPTLVFLGATMGAAVTPETLALMSRWPLSLAGLAAAVYAIMLASSVYLERVHGFDRATARLSAVPGALPYVLAVAMESTADQRRVAIIQCGWRPCS